jgi:ABC-type multidrug transport system fused ATPase/permease subunit
MRAVKRALGAIGRVAGRPVRAWRRLRPLLGDRSVPVLILSGASIGVGIAEAGVLVLVAQIAAAMVVRSSEIHARIGPGSLHFGIATALVVALVLALVRLLLQLVVAWLPARISADVTNRLREELFDAFTRASWRVQAAEREGHLQELMTNQVAQATQAVLMLANIVSSAAMFAVLAASAFVLSWEVALVVLVSSVLLFGVLRPLIRFGRASARELSQASVDQAAGVSEAVRLAEETQVFGVLEAQRERLRALIQAARSAFFRFQLAARLSQSSYQSLAILFIVGGLAALYVTGAGDVAALGAVVLMLVRAAQYGQTIQGGYQGLAQVLPYLDRLEAAVARYEASTPAERDRPLPTIRTLAFEQVDFAYVPGRPALRGVSFWVDAGEAIGIVGPSGAGKSTLVQLLLRLREPHSGAYLVNGELAQSFARTEWQRRVAYVPQEPKVLQGTVAENIRFFRDIDDETVERAARLAHIHQDVVAMAAGYETVIGQRADAVSGGQRQRICLARALAGDPDVLVLDEPTSALDLPSEAAIQASLAELHGRVTLFIVAHRPSTLTICDRVLVMGDSTVQAFAPAAELDGTNRFFHEAGALSGRPA